MKRILVYLSLVVVLVTGCGKEKTVTFEKSMAKEDMNTINISGYTEKDSTDENYFDTWIDFQEKTITYTSQGETKTTSLDDEQVEALRTYMYDFVNDASKKESEYWPHSKEYPDMLTLFMIRVNDGSYRLDGALCYPDGWNDMLDMIQELIEEE